MTCFSLSGRARAGLLMIDDDCGVQWPVLPLSGRGRAGLLMIDDDCDVWWLVTPLSKRNETDLLMIGDDYDVQWPVPPLNKKTKQAHRWFVMIVGGLKKWWWWRVKHIKIVCFVCSQTKQLMCYVVYEMIQFHL